MSKKSMMSHNVCYDKKFRRFGFVRGFFDGLSVMVDYSGLV